MPSRSTVIALLALFAAFAGTATAAKLVNGKYIRKGTVASKQIKDGTIKQRDLHRRTIAALRKRLDPIGPGAVGSREIADGSIALADLAPSSVDGSRVVDRSLTAGDLVAETITATELGTGSVGDDELAPNSVGNSEIKGNAISRNQIRPNVLRADRVGADFGDVAAGECEAQDVPGATYSIPTGAFANAAIVVGAPAGLSDGLVVEGRSPNGDDLRIQVCNLTGAPVAVGEQEFPVVTLGT